MSTTRTSEDAVLRERVEGLVEAIRAKDIDALMAHYAPDVVVFDLMPLQCLGADVYRKNFEAWFASVQGPIGYEMRDLRITTRDDAAFCHYLGHVRTARKSGKRADYQVRVTVGLQKMSGQWLVTHEHVSLPFRNRETLQAALDPHQA